MRAMRCLAVIGLAGWLFSFATSAHDAPNWTIDPGVGHGGGASSQSTAGAIRTIAVSRRSAPATAGESTPNTTSSLQATLQHALSRPAPASEPSDAAIRTLSFRHDPEVSARVRQSVLDHMAGQPDGPALDAVRSGKLLDAFDRLLRQYAYSPDNLGDVLAAYLIISWEIVNDRDSTKVRAGLKAVRRQLIVPLAKLPKYMSMSDAEKQSQAERTAYMTMIAVGASESLKQAGDATRLQALQKSVRAGALESGIDLEKLELTDGGLVIRP